MARFFILLFTIASKCFNCAKCPILSLSQFQDQLAATASKEFDPLGPLPHGWGKYH